jgi:hypothetical protein
MFNIRKIPSDKTAMNTSGYQINAILTTILNLGKAW